MKLVVIHYHLGHGGVSRVITNQLRSFARVLGDQAQLDVLFLCAGTAHIGHDMQGVRVTHEPVAGLDYDERGGSRDPDTLYAELAQNLVDHGFGPQDCVVQVHNHALGKNFALPGALTRLALDGYRLLLQVHDFAEDCRPHLYRRLVDALDPGATELTTRLYPQAPQIHYAVINSRDRRILAQAGVDRSRLHLLPNPVHESPPASRAAARAKLERLIRLGQDKRFILYPVRGILRKNLGEALLWATILQQNGVVGITLPPVSQIDQPRFTAWREMARNRDLPCLFNVGLTQGIGLAELFAAADGVLTCSVAEGFGMVFLETALAGRPLVGRDLPDITADFKSRGLQFDGLGAELLVPLDWVGYRRFASDFADAYLSLLAAYRAPGPGHDAIARRALELTDSVNVDFGYLTPRLQQQALETMIRSGDSRRQVRELNPWMHAGIDPESCAPTIRHNAALVRRFYGEETIGRKLMSVYDAVIRSEASDRLDTPLAGSSILEEFLDIAAFRPVRLEL